MNTSSFSSAAGCTTFVTRAVATVAAVDGGWAFRRREVFLAIAILLWLIKPTVWRCLAREFSCELPEVGTLIATGAMRAFVSCNDSLGLRHVEHGALFCHKVRRARRINEVRLVEA